MLFFKKKKTESSDVKTKIKLTEALVERVLTHEGWRRKTDTKIKVETPKKAARKGK